MIRFFCGDCHTEMTLDEVETYMARKHATRVHTKGLGQEPLRHHDPMICIAVLERKLAAVRQRAAREQSTPPPSA